MNRPSYRLLLDDEMFMLSQARRQVVESVAAACLEAEAALLPPAVPVEIGLTLVDNTEIQTLNRKHRGIDTPTDVLSFPLYEPAELAEGCTESGIESDYLLLGDIVLSMETALAQAEAYGHSPERELGFLTAHSILHLLGYDHETQAEEEIMLAKQNEIMTKVGLNR